MKDISEINELTKLISKLPGLGKRSSNRIILKLINNQQELMKPIINSLMNVVKYVSRCKSCGTLKSNLSGCNNCENLSK